MYFLVLALMAYANNSVLYDYLFTSDLKLFFPFSCICSLEFESLKCSPVRFWYN